MEIENAYIRDTTIHLESNCVIIGLMLESATTKRMFGPYIGFQPGEHTKMNFIAGHLIWKILRLAEANSFDKLVGKVVRVKMLGSNIVAIGHIFKDDWLEPKVDYFKGKELTPDQAKPVSQVSTQAVASSMSEADRLRQELNALTELHNKGHRSSYDKAQFIRKLKSLVRTLED